LETAASVDSPELGSFRRYAAFGDQNLLLFFVQNKGKVGRFQLSIMMLERRVIFVKCLNRGVGSLETSLNRGWQFGNCRQQWRELPPTAPK
jgi:hypothetical protein